MQTTHDLNVLLVLVVLAIVALIELSKLKYLVLLYIPLFILVPSTLLFLPLFILDAPFKFLIVIPAFLLINSDPVLIILTLLSFVIRQDTCLLEAQQKELITVKDKSRFNELSNKAYTRALSTSHEQALTHATLQERNRIARDIHDSVGHKLSSSIIQLGAIEVLNQQEALSPDLKDLKDTLDSAMDAIRSSVHHLHNRSIDLEIEIDKLTKVVQHIDVDYKYHLETTPANESIVCFLFIIKEALHNIHKHSNATKLKLHVSQSLDSIHLLIHDNGTQISESTRFGMGLSNMQIRVNTLRGTFNIQTNAGYRIYVSLPKENTK